MDSSQAKQQKDFYDGEFKTIVPKGMEENIRQFYFEKIYSILSANVPPKEGERLLEVGTGQGGIMERMVGAYPGCHFEGMDISQKNVEAAQKRGLNIYWGDANALDTSKRFDAIYGTAILHHLDDLPNFFKQVHAMLKPGGWVMFGPEPVWYAFVCVMYHRLRGNWPVEKGMMQISVSKLRKIMSPYFKDMRFYRHGTAFVYFSRRLGHLWNVTHCSKIPFLNDIYVYARRKD